jgi:hypothetical protein
MTASRKTLEDVLLAAQRLGTLGDRPIPEVIEHARYFVQALEGVTGCVADIGTGAGVPGLVIAVDWLIGAKTGWTNCLAASPRWDCRTECEC